MTRDAVGRKLLQIQLGGVISALNAGQLNQAAVQQLAQAGIFGTATNGAVVVQGNAAGAAPTYCLLLIKLAAAVLNGIF